jgi:transcription initiation factor TFIIB
VPEHTPVKKCPECSCEKIVKDPETGEEICGKCGVVVSFKSINFGPEWRAFTLQQREELPRTGAPVNLMIHDKGLSTSIGWKNIDGTGKRMKQSQKYKFYRLRKWNRRSRIIESRQRNLAYALSYIGNIGNELNLPRNVVETASSIYRKILKKGVTKGRAIKSLAASAIYTACRQCNVIRTLNDIAETTEFSKKEIARTYRFMYKNIEKDVPLFSCRKYVSKYVNHLGFNGETELTALKLLSEASEQQLTVGRSPRGIAAACLYIACQINGDRRTQGEIAQVAQVTEVTIRNRYKELLNKLELVIKV